MKYPFPLERENAFPMSEYHGKTLPEVNFSQNNYFLPLNLFLSPFIASEPITGVQILSGKYWLSRKVMTWVEKYCPCYIIRLIIKRSADLADKSQGNISETRF